MQPIQHIGYIGLGIMGSAMAANLIKAGFKVTVWNRTAGKCDALAAQGAQVASSPEDLATREPDLICLNVSDTPDVEHVLFGKRGLIEGARAGLIVVDHSTISPVATQQFAAKLADRQVVFLDAPVSGGDVGARNGTLTMMVGGREDAFTRCLPAFEAMAKSITHLGPAGMGQVCKACNQIAVVCNLMGVCEAMALAQRSGLDVEKMIQTIGAGAAGSWQLANLGPRIAKGDFNPGFMIDLVLKDLAIVANTARASSLPLPATALAETMFRAVKADAGGDPPQDGGRLGTQAMAKAFEKLGGFRFQG
ncbi:MAG: NAD(P)-dependent oxidoreductase [Phycisphaeraceae bacterium]